METRSTTHAPVTATSASGLYIAPADLDRALEPFRKIRAAVGDRIDIMVEFHSLWNLPTAIRIAQALEEFRIAPLHAPGLGTRLQPGLETRRDAVVRKSALGLRTARRTAP